MAASYPGGIKTFPTYANGDQVTPITINDPDLEITAIETGLIDGFAHHLIPDTTAAHRSLGTTGNQWYDLVLGHNATVGGTLTVTGGVTLSGALTIGSVTVTGNATVGGTLGVTGASDFGGAVVMHSTLTMSGTISVPTGTPIYLDGGGNTYLDEASADLVQIVAGGAASFNAGLGFVSVPSTNKIFLDGGSDTYVREGTANIVEIVAGGTLGFSVTAGAVVVPATNLLYLDGGGDTYLKEESANVIQLVAGTVTAMRAHVDGISIPATSRVYLDGRDDTYIREESANQIQLVCGGSSGLRVTSALATVGGALAVTGAATVGTTLDVHTAVLSNVQTGTTVTTSPTTIYTAAQVNSADVGGLALVCGTKAGDATVQFVDWVLLMSDGAADLIAGHSKGAAASRVYSWSGLAFQLTMGADSYHVSVLPMLVGTTGA